MERNFLKPVKISSLSNAYHTGACISIGYQSFEGNWQVVNASSSNKAHDTTCGVIVANEAILTDLAE